VAPVRQVSLAELRQAFPDCDVVGRPAAMYVVGRTTGEWLVAPPEFDPEKASWFSGVVLDFIDAHLPGSWPVGAWSLFFIEDGWGEHLPPTERYEWTSANTSVVGHFVQVAPGHVPVLSARRPGVLCFGAHIGDPSAVLVPDPYFLSGGVHHGMAEVATLDVPWEAKADRFVLAASPHGHPNNTPGQAWPSNREHLAAHVADHGLPVEVHLGHIGDGWMSRADQLQAKYLVDVDGRVRTWDAFAWKSVSNSVVLRVDSHWDIWWREAFVPWVHFVPVASDFADLAERIDWCASHDDECHAIAVRGAERAREVFTRDHAAAVVRDRLEAHLRGQLHAHVDVAPDWFATA
jgi:hypothetical protein